MSDGHVVIESGDYEQTRQRLMKDPIVKDMADQLAFGIAQGQKIVQLTHEGGGPTMSFMMGANEEYRKRGGQDGGHMGAIAEAILRLLNG